MKSPALPNVIGGTCEPEKKRLKIIDKSRDLPKTLYSTNSLSSDLILIKDNYDDSQASKEYRSKNLNDNNNYYNVMNDISTNLNSQLKSLCDLLYSNQKIPRNVVQLIFSSFVDIFDTYNRKLQEHAILVEKNRNFSSLELEKLYH